MCSCGTRKRRISVRIALYNEWQYSFNTRLAQRSLRSHRCLAVPAVLNQYFVPPLMSNPATFCALVASNTPGIGAAALSPSSATAPYVFTHSTLRGATTATAPPSLNQICSCCGRLRKGHGRRGKWGKSCIHTTCKCGRLASDHRSGVTFGPYCTLESMNSI